MMEILKQLPHLEPYGDPQYFVYIILAVLPIFIGLFFKKRFPLYEVLVSLAFIIFMLVGPEDVYKRQGLEVFQVISRFGFLIHFLKKGSWKFLIRCKLTEIPLSIQPTIAILIFQLILLRPLMTMSFR